MALADERPRNEYGNAEHIIVAFPGMVMHFVFKRLDEQLDHLI